MKKKPKEEKKPFDTVIKNVRIVRVNIKVSWEPSCCQLVTVYFSDPDGTLTMHYDIGGKDSTVEPSFTIPFFKGAQRHTGRIHTSLVALAWVLDQSMYLKAEGELVRVRADHYPEKGANIRALGNITHERWLEDNEDLQDIPYPYCIFRKEYVPET